MNQFSGFIRRLLGLYLFDYNRNQLNLNARKWHYTPITFFWWIVLFPCFIVDVIGGFKLLNILLNTIRKTRVLTTYEIEALSLVFGNSVDFLKIRIVEKSYLAKLGSKFNHSKKLGFVLFRTVNFSSQIDCANNSKDMMWLVHEMVHVSQFNTVGFIYIIKALRAQKNGGYSYEMNWLKMPLKSFNFEQQGDIAKHYYQSYINDKTIEPYRIVIKEIRQQKF